jgi:hypothetical protein
MTTKKPKLPIIPFASPGAREAWLEEHHTTSDGLCLKWWAWVSSGLGVHRSSALRSSIVFDPAVQRLGGVLSVAGIACSSQTIDSDNSASESFSSARKHTSLVFVLSYLPREL